MPDVTYTFAWTTLADRNAWWPYSDYSLASSQGSDFTGATTPGCMILNAQLVDAGDIYLNDARFLLFNWQSLGVPAGKFVTSVSARMRAIQNTDSGFDTVLGQITVSDLTTWAYLYNVPDLKATVTTSWSTVTMPAVAIPEALAASDAALRLQFFALGHSTQVGGITVLTRFIYLFDTLELTITYADAWSA